jgi:hypothetical protein
VSSTVRPLVHIGLAKSASTFLQQAIFPKLPQIEYLGKNTPDENLRKAGMMVVRATSITYQEARALEAFSTPLIRAGELGHRAIYSEEDLSVFKFLDPEMMAIRLKTILGTYDVLMISRDPFHWVQSNYQFRLSTYQPRTLWGMNHWLREHMRVVGIGSDITEIHYTGILDTYARHCGGKINMIPYELLAKSPIAFSDHLATVVGTGADVIRAEITKPRDRKLYKGRITQMESNFIREARRILARDFDGFIRALEPYLAQSGAKPNEKALEELILLSQAKVEDFSVWVDPLLRLRVSMSRTFDKASLPAAEELDDDLLESIDRVGRIQKRLAREKYAVDLNSFGIRYHGEK